MMSLAKYSRIQIGIGIHYYYLKSKKYTWQHQLISTNLNTTEWVNKEKERRREFIYNCEVKMHSGGLNNLWPDPHRAPLSRESHGSYTNQEGTSQEELLLHNMLDVVGAAGS